MAGMNLAKRFFTSKIGKMCQCFNFVRHKSDGTKVVLLSSYNTLGISTAYLLKKSNLFTEICLQESKNVPNIKGIAADLNAINTPAVVTDCVGIHSMAEALEDASIVVILERERKKRKKKYKISDCKMECGPLFQKAAEDLDKLFLKNAELCAKAAELYAQICPGALFAVAVPPINSIVPLMCSIAVNTNHNVDIRKILGIMSSDVVRTNTIWAKKANTKRDSTNVPIIGGATPATLIPLFSQLPIPDPEDPLSEEDYKKLTDEARVNSTKAPLASAASISKFVLSLGTLLSGNEMKEILYVATNVFPETNYIAGTTQLGPAGVQFVLPFPDLSDYEKLLLDSLAFYLKTDIKRGENYASTYLRRKKRLC